MKVKKKHVENDETRYEQTNGYHVLIFAVHFFTVIVLMMLVVMCSKNIENFI
jgi:nitrogen fixation protein FixH